jgi:hypothetical protein
MDKSNVKLKSKIILSQNVKKIGIQNYIPATLLIKLYPHMKDKRLRDMITK